jgi:hypothetical protein
MAKLSALRTVHVVLLSHTQAGMKYIHVETLIIVAVDKEMLCSWC